MPIPGTNIPLPGDPDFRWPWDKPAPAQPAPEPEDTSARDAVLTQVGGLHGSLTGKPVPVPNPDFDPKKPEGPDNPKSSAFDQYTFSDGSTLEIAPTGEVQKFTAKAVTKPPTPGGEAVSAPSSDRYIVRRDDQGNLTAVDNPNFKGDTKDPTSQITTFGDQLVGVTKNADGTLSTQVLLTKDPTKKEPSVINLPDGSLGQYDPSKTGPDAISVLVPAAGNKNPGTPIKGGDGGWYVWSPQANGGKGGFVDTGIPPEQKPSKLVGTDVNSPVIYAIDDQGNEVAGSRRPNPNYTAGKPTQLQADLVSPKVPLLKADGSIDWQDNQNQVKVSQAMADLMNQAGVKVAAGSMSMADAKDILTGAVNTMNAQTQQADVRQRAAQALLTNQAQGATTGAGILQNRVTTAASLLSNVLQAGNQGNERFGNFSGGTVPWAPGTGQLLVNGIQQYLTGLGGGQDVYDTAARLVRQSDPTAQGDHPAIGALNDLLTAYHGATGGPHPEVVNTQALRQQAGGANGGQQQTGVGVGAAGPTIGPVPTQSFQFSSPPLGATPTPSPVSLQLAQPPQMTSSPFAGVQAASLNPPTQPSGSTVPYQVAGASLPNNPMFDANGQYVGPANFNFSGQSFQAPTTVPYTVQPGVTNVRPLTMAQLGAT